MVNKTTRWRIGAMLVLLISLGLLLAIGVGMLGKWFWWLDLFSHFRAQYAAPAALCVFIAALRRYWKITLIALLPLVICLGSILPFYFGKTDSSRSAANLDTELKIIHFNIYSWNPNHEKVIRYLDESGAQIAFLQEITSEWVEVLKQSTSSWRIETVHPRTDNFGIAMLVRQSTDSPILVISTHIVHLPDNSDLAVPAIEATIRNGKLEVAILSLHTLPPVNHEYTLTRNEQLAAAREWSKRQSLPHVILGDLNASPWSYAFKMLCSEPRLTNSQYGFGLQATWPANRLAILRIPIDHCLHSDDLVTLNRSLGPPLGSDHLPLKLVLAPAEPIPN